MFLPERLYTSVKRENLFLRDSIRKFDQGSDNPISVKHIRVGRYFDPFGI